MHLNAVILSNLILICLNNIFCLYSAKSCWLLILWYLNLCFSGLFVTCFSVLICMIDDNFSLSDNRVLVQIHFYCAGLSRSKSNSTLSMTVKRRRVLFIKEKEQCSGISSAVEVHSFTIQLKDIEAFLFNVAIIFRLSYFFILCHDVQRWWQWEKLSSFHAEWSGQMASAWRFGVCLW